MKFKNNLSFSILLLFLFANQIQAQLYVEGSLYVDEGAGIHVWNDVVIATATGHIANSGMIEVQGNWTLDEEASFEGNPSDAGPRRIAFRNDNFNTDGDQRISGPMNGNNAFYNLTIDNTGTNGVVDMDDNVEVRNNLHFMNGRLRTDIAGQGADGNAYAYEVHLTNFDEDAVSGQTLSGGTDRYVEGKLRRNVFGMGKTFEFPVGVAPDAGEGAEPFAITFTNQLPSSNLLAVYQNGTTTNTGSTQVCDVGTGGDNPDPFTPDGNLDELDIDCGFGQWSILASENFDYEYDITFHPGETLQSLCPDALYFFVGKDGELGNCPDMDGEPGISRTGLTGFSIFDIATASESSTILVGIEVIPTDDKRVVLFPNPVQNSQVNLSLEGDVFGQGEARLEIYNPLGKLIHQETVDLKSGNKVIQIESLDWQAGFYELVLKNDKRLVSKSFVIVEN